jgi:hypothetical protein
MDRTIPGAFSILAKSPCNLVLGTGPSLYAVRFGRMFFRGWKTMQRTSEGPVPNTRLHGLLAKMENAPGMVRSMPKYYAIDFRLSYGKFCMAYVYYWLTVVCTLLILSHPSNDH